MAPGRQFKIMTRYFDAHSHLQEYASARELTSALAAAKAAGVELTLCCGTSPGDWEKVAALSAAACGRVIPCFGLHPWFIKEGVPGWLEALEGLLMRLPSCVGEIGLDGGKNGTDAARQEGVFRAQLGLAKKLGRPACLHCVRAWGRMLEIIKEDRPGPFLLHSYGGAPEMMADFAGLGGYFSFGGALLDPKRGKLRRALLAAPPDRLLFETEAPEPDAPGWRAAPAGIAEVTAAAAAILGKTAEETAALSRENGRIFLGALAAAAVKATPPREGEGEIKPPL